MGFLEGKHFVFGGGAWRLALGLPIVDFAEAAPTE
jgi:hypothetical protein